MKRLSILILDNYDSFTFNLVQLFGQLDAQVRVERNDALDVAGVAALRPDGLVISPGPGTPSEAGICTAAIRALHSRIPILGVCLGHQCIGEAFGGRVVRAPCLMHGKTSAVTHSGAALLRGLPSPLQATRYHSLVVERASLPAVLQVDAAAEDGTIMAMHHSSSPVFGVQFHPESVMTPQGDRIARNFLEVCRAVQGALDQ